MIILEELEKYNITPGDLVWVLVCQGKLTIEQAVKFHMKEVTFEELVKEIKRDDPTGI